MRKILLIISMMYALVACRRIQEQRMETQPRPLRVEVMTVGQEAKVGQHTYIGQIRPAAEFSIYYAMGGQLLHLHVHNGEQVKQGQPIADFDDTQARAMHASAEAIRQQAEDGYRRMVPLHEKGVVTEVQWIEMQTNLEKARQSVQVAAKTLSDCHLTAPQDGVIGSVEAHAGQHMLPGQTICTLLDIRHLEAEFTVPEQDMPLVHIGDSVRVLVNATDSTYRAVIRSKNLTANPIAHTYTVRAQLFTTIPTPGSSISVLLMMPGSEGALVIPGRCVQITPQGPAVWIAENGYARRHPISITRYAANGVEVAAGLEPGEHIITAGYQKLYNGAPIQYDTISE